MHKVTLAILIGMLVLAPGQVLANEKKPRLKGIVVTVHASLKSVEIETKSGELQTFYVTDATTYVKDKMPVQLSALKRDVPVSVHYVLQNRKMVATKVVLSPKK